jgi:hypothetical protein
MQNRSSKRREEEKATENMSEEKYTSKTFSRHKEIHTKYVTEKMWKDKDKERILSTERKLTTYMDK